MGIRQSRVIRWRGVFRALQRTDLLLLYSGLAPQSASAVWHSHPRNHTPHVHVEFAADEHPGHSHTDHDARHRHQHDSHHHEESHDNDGHWHFVIAPQSLEPLQLLIFAIVEINIAVSSQIGALTGDSCVHLARGPPSLDSLS